MDLVLEVDPQVPSYYGKPSIKVIYRYGPFYKTQILDELIFVFKIWSVPSESLIGRLNASTTDGRGNLPFALMRTLCLFWFYGDAC